MPSLCFGFLVCTKPHMYICSSLGLFRAFSFVRCPLSPALVAPRDAWRVTRDCPPAPGGVLFMPHDSRTSFPLQSSIPHCSAPSPPVGRNRIDTLRLIRYVSNPMLLRHSVRFQCLRPAFASSTCTRTARLPSTPSFCCYVAPRTPSTPGSGAWWEAKSGPTRQRGKPDCGR